MKGRDIRYIIAALGHVPANQREDAVTRAAPLFRDDMSGYEIGSIIRAVADVAADKRADAVTRAAPLINDNMRGYQIGCIIEAVANVAANEWADVLTLATPLFRDNMNGGISSIIRAVANLAPVERADIVTRAAPLINEGEGANIISIINEIPLTHRGLVEYCSTLNELDYLQYAFQIVEQASHRAFSAVLIQRINAEQERVLEARHAGTEYAPFNIQDLIWQSGADITNRMVPQRPRAFNAGQAYEIHNALKVMVTMGNQKMVAPTAIRYVLQSLEVKRMPLRAAVAEMHALAECVLRRP